jgi:ATP-dependent exoDNAse (exonuclease V) alpha subunit
MARRIREPFGGVQIVMFGDLFQLPPVVKNEERALLSMFYSSDYFFAATIWKEIHFNIIELNHIFRQSDENFISILNHVREYQISNDEIEELESTRSTKDSERFDTHAIHVCALRKTVQKINTELLGTPTHFFEAQISSDFNQSSIPCDKKLELRVGARVMMLVNSKLQGFCNGSLGEIVEISDKLTIKLDNGKLVEVERHEWNDIEYVEENGKIVSKKKGYCRQFPVTLAWAITIHKSQGLTFDNVIIHTQGIFAPGQLYVALSRCTSLEGIVTDSFISKKQIFPDKTLIDFVKQYQANEYTYLRE